jgi:hypothetical protein
MKSMIKHTAMVLPAIVVILAIGAGVLVAAQPRDLLARFDGGIGVIPVTGVANAQADGTFGNVLQNVVRGVPPSNQAWTIGDLKADVDTDGRIKVRGRGLVLAGGARLGQSLQLSVTATLMCETTGTVIPQHTTIGTVQLDRNGDFRIDDLLDSAPAACAAPLLLIRNGKGGPWLAAGLPKFFDVN